MNGRVSLQARIDDYLAERRRLGFQLRTRDTFLAGFARFVASRHHRGPLTVELMTNWVRQGKGGEGSPGTWARRLAKLRHFIGYLKQFEPQTEVPEASLFGPEPGRVAPYIYREEEIVELLAAARKLGPRASVRPATFETLFGLMASCGLRVSEAIHLRDADVDLKHAILVVRQTKFAKSRQLPMHPSTVEALARYRRTRARHVPTSADMPFFIGSRGRRLGQPLGDRQTHQVFNALRDRLGWVNRGAHEAHEAAYRWLHETEEKRSHHSDLIIVKWLQTHLSMKLLQEITRELVWRISEVKRSETSASRANRVVALIRSVLRRAAADWGWLDKAPALRMYREPKRRVRWLTPEELNRLLGELKEHQREAVIFAAATGLRQANVIRLEWSQVNLEANTAWIYADQAKGGRDIHVSLNETALAVLRRQMGKHPVRVFTFKGKPYNRAYTKAWQAALKRAGIENFRWHDIRHTWASWLAQKGVPLSDIQEMGGWETPSMVQRYAHLSPAHLAHRAKLLDGLIDTNSAQSPNA